MPMMPTYDYESERDALLRQQNIINAMQQQNLQPMGGTETAAGGYAVKKSPMEGIAKIANAFMLSQGQQNLQNDQKALGTRYAGDLKTDMGNFMSAMNAQPGTTPAVEGNNPSAFVPAQTTTPADVSRNRQQAIMDAISSNHPVMQQFGMGQLQYMMKNDQMTMKDWLDLAGGGKYEPDSVVAAQRAGNTALLKPAKQYHTVNNQLVDTTNTPTVALDGRDKFGPVSTVAQTPGGPVLGQQNSGTGEVKFAPPGTNINLNTTTTGANELAKGAVANLQESYKTAKDLPQVYSGLQQARQFLDAGVKAGSASDAAMQISKASEALGLGPVDPTIANTETFRAKLANQVLEKVKALKPASDTDIKYAKEASGANLQLSLQALNNLLDSATAATVNTYRRHSQLYDSMQGRPGYDQHDLASYNVPMDIHMPADRFDYQGGQFVPRNPSIQGTPSQPIPLADYLKSKGG